MKEGIKLVSKKEQMSEKELSVAPYKAYESMIKDGRCTVEELLTAKETLLINQEEFVLLLTKYAQWLEKMRGIDPLTEVFNRAFLKPKFEELIKELNCEIEKRKSPLESVVVIYLDIKKFKEINDTYGHSVGDKALKAVVEKLQSSTKREDMIFRVGGDEFVVLLPVSNGDVSCDLIFQRIKKSMATSLVVDLGDKKIPIKVSMGFEVLKKGDGEGSLVIEEILDRADQKMYEDKRR